MCVVAVSVCLRALYNYDRSFEANYVESCNKPKDPFTLSSLRLKSHVRVSPVLCSEAPTNQGMSRRV